MKPWCTKLAPHAGRQQTWATASVLAEVFTHSCAIRSLSSSASKSLVYDLQGRAGAVQVKRAACGGKAGTEFGWRHGVMEKKDVPVRNLLSDTFPN